MLRNIYVYRDDVMKHEKFQIEAETYGDFVNLMESNGVNLSKYQVFESTTRIEYTRSRLDTKLPESSVNPLNGERTTDLYFSMNKREKNIDTARSTSRFSINRVKAKELLENKGLLDRLCENTGRKFSNTSTDTIVDFINGELGCVPEELELRIVGRTGKTVDDTEDIQKTENDDEPECLEYENPEPEFHSDEPQEDSFISDAEEYIAHNKTVEKAFKEFVEKETGDVDMSVFTPIFRMILIRHEIGKLYRPQLEDVASYIGEILKDMDEDEREQHENECINEYMRTVSEQLK